MTTTDDSGEAGGAADVTADAAEPTAGTPEVEAVASADAPDGGSVAPSGSTAQEFADLVAVLEQTTAERDEFLDTARRVQAEFENYKRRVEGQRIEQVERAAEALVVELLPVLDACEAALAHGHEDVLPVGSALYATLEKRGLATIDADDSFDPERHDAVLREEGDGGPDGPVIVEVMRTGYTWNGRVVRPAMVKVRG